jgi:hypothetical protein
VFFNFVYGNKVYNNNNYFLEGGGTRDANRAMDIYQLNRWQKPGDITNMPRLTAMDKIIPSAQPPVILKTVRFYA